MSEELLHIEGLNVAFETANGSFDVVRNLNLSLHRGEILAVVGESGSGKSVSMKTLGRLLGPNAKVTAKRAEYQLGDGTIDLLTCSEQEMRTLRSNSLAYVFQEPMSALHPLITCGEQVAEAIRAHKELNGGDVRKEVIQLFAEMKLPEPGEVYDAYPHELSGGQRQRIMIALALCNDPDLLVADEPTTALDTVLQRTVIELLTESCRKRSTGLILISHDIDLVKDHTDNCLVMYRGDVMEYGSTHDVVQNPKHPYTKALIKCRPSYQNKAFVLPTVDRLLEGEGDSMKELKYTPEHLPVRKLPDASVCTIRDLELVYPGKRNHKALNGLNFEIQEGETLGIVGESGSGKSTLAKVVIRLLQADGGEIEFQLGWESLKRKEFASKIQMIFQDPFSSLNPNLTVGQTISEVLKVHRICEKNQRDSYVSKLLDEVGLNASDSDKYPHEFSGGQRQRISIARALAVEPSMIICDESVAALDVSVQAQVLNLLKKIQRDRDLSYLFITHDLHVVSYISDRILVLKEGEIIELSKTDKIIKAPDSEYTNKLFSGVRGEL